MKKSIYTIMALMSISAFMSCNESDESAESTMNTTAPISNPTDSATTSTDISSLNNVSTATTDSGAMTTTVPQVTNNPQEIKLQQTTTPQPSSQPQPQVAKSSGKVKDPNPEHGKPGHRCDIPVGASLSTPIQQMPQPKAQATSSPINTTTGQAQVMPTTPPKQETAPGFAGKPNPEHGKPGHRCDLPVGTTLP